MAWRKWLVRSLVFTIAAGLAVAVFFYQRWTDPEKVRAQVLAELGQHFAGARVGAESAHFHLFGGITVTEARLSRRGDQDNTELAYVPTLTIYLDKEQLLHGKQNVRKLELERPRLRVIRDASGRWNLDGILGEVDPNEPIPTIVIHHGTLIVEDRLAAPQAPPVEIKEVNLTILNDPLLVLSIAGSGSSDLGPVQIAASYQRKSTELKLSLEALEVPVGPALVQRLAGYNADLAAHVRQLEGVGKLHVDLAYQPEARRPWSHDVLFQLRQAKLTHARLPFPLEQVEASIRYVNGHVPAVKIAARSDRAKLDLTLKDLDITRIEQGCEQAARELDLHIEHLTLTRDLFAALPKSQATLREVEADYEPRGPISLDYSLRHDPSGGWRERCVIKPEGVRAEYAKFPYPLDDVTGIIEQESASTAPEVLKLNLVGRAGSRPISIRGEVRGQQPATATTGGSKAPSFVSIDIRGDNVPLDDRLVAALLPKGQKRSGGSKPYDLARSFNPSTGSADFQAFIRRDGRSPQFANRFLINFHDAAIRYKVFPYPLENVAGTLDIQPGHWEFRDFKGTHKGGEFHGRGRSVPTPDGDRVEVFLDGTGLQLDDELKEALEDELQRTWIKLQPTGRIDFTARVDIPPGPDKPHKHEIDLAVQARGCTIRPDFFKYTISDLTGKIRYAKRWVMLDDLHGLHGKSVFTLKDGLVYVKEGGGVWAQLGKLHGNPLARDDEFLSALPSCLSKACQCLQWRDPVQLEAKLVIDTRPEQPPVFYWDGSVTLQNAQLKTGVELTGVTGTVACLGLHDGRQLQGVVGNLVLEQATLFDQPLHSIHSRFEVTKEEPDILKLPGLYAQFCGGEVYGPLRIEFGPVLRYEMNLTASRVKLEEFARQNAGLKSELSGEATAQVYLIGRGDNPDELKGSGRIDVPKGKIENLPPLVNLLKFLALRLPDRTAFEEAHSEFEIQGQRARVTRLDLFGNAISLRGQGDLRLDGSDLNLDFNTDWARLGQVLPPEIRKFPQAISNQLLRIKMRGSVSDPTFKRDYMPLVTDPAKRMWNDIKRDGQREGMGKQ
jgi:hypothetical protein